LTAGSSITAFGNTTGTVSGNIVENSATIRNLSIGSGTNNGTVVLSGNNTYRGRTSISAGSLSVATINSVVGGTASSNMGAPTTVDNGTVNLGSGENAGTLIYTGAGETTDRVLNLNGTTGGGAVTQNGTGLLKFTSDLTATGAGLKNLTLQGSGTGEIAGRVVDNSSLNLTGVVKTGTGTWILSAANDYKGRTSVNNGILSVSSINSVTGGTATSNLGAPTTVENGTINLGNTTSTGELLYTGTGETTDRVINLAGTTGGGIITNNGTGLLKFTSDLTATGLGNKTLTLQGSGNGEFAGAIVSSTGFNTGVAKSGTGTWTLSGANTYTGTTTVNDGTLRLAGVGLLSGGPLTMNGGILDLNGTTQTVGTLSGASGAVIRNGAAATNITFTYNQAASGTYAGIIEDGNGTLAVTKGGTFTSTLTGMNTYTGLTTVSEGALVVGSNTALGSAVAGTLVQNTARVILADGVTVTGEEITIQGQGGGNGALQAFANSTATWNGNVKTVGTDVRLGAQAGGHLIINGDIGRAEGSTTSTITFRTVGDASTSGAELENTGVTLGGIYNLANINIFQGFVKIGASDRIADTTVVTLGTTASENIRQRFDLNGFNETIAGITTAGSAPSATHEVTNTSATASTLTLNSGTNRTFGGVVTGNLAIVKAGNNTVTFSGINSYTGNTTVNAGTFNVTGQLNGGGSLNVVTGATFTLGSAGVFQFNIGENGVNNVISGAGTTNLNGFLNFNLSFASIAEGNAWDLFETTGATSWNLAGVTSSAGNFTNNSGIWTLDEDGRSWSFDQTSGVLSLVQVPEPSQMLLTLGGLAGFALRRRRAI
jgi:autotransporter-associated beta strand protein